MTYLCEIPPPLSSIVVKMRISKDKYYKDMAKALLRGYFAGLKESRKNKERKISVQKSLFQFSAL